MKRKKIIKTILIVVLMILLVPFPIFYKDGGTVEYRAVVYDITRYHKLDDSPMSSGYKKGWRIELFGMEVFDNFNK